MKEKKLLILFGVRSKENLPAVEKNQIPIDIWIKSCKKIVKSKEQHGAKYELLTKIFTEFCVL